MNNCDLILNVATNLGRLGRWAQSGQASRIPQFLADTQTYLNQIQNISPQFCPTYDRFLKDFLYLKSASSDSPNWPDTAFTWAAILTHRAKLA